MAVSDITAISSAQTTFRGNPTHPFDLQIEIGVSIHSVRGVSQRFVIVVVVITPKPLMKRQKNAETVGV